ncbi:MAG: sulfurtransferase [Gammaproteobacteria bacterium]|nr:MAG: sulfurtransferase [Gammaproteobacteria bacterium]
MIRELQVTELAKELADNDKTLTTANIWDVRDESAYLAGHIAGATNQPINAGIAKQTLDNAQGTVYVLCGGGSKAPRAAATLEELDNSRDIVILTGGTRGAKSAGMTIVTGEQPL